MKTLHTNMCQIHMGSLMWKTLEMEPSGIWLQWHWAILPQVPNHQVPVLCILANFRKPRVQSLTWNASLSIENKRSFESPCRYLAKKTRGWFEHHPSGCSSRGVCVIRLYRSQRTYVYTYLHCGHYTSCSWWLDSISWYVFLFLFISTTVMKYPVEGKNLKQFMRSDFYEAPAC